MTTTPVAPTVTLYLRRIDEWSCDCGGKVDPCASTSPPPRSRWRAGPSLSRPRPNAEAAASPPSVIGYRLASRDGRLTMNRVVVRPGKPDEAIRGSVASDQFRVKYRDVAPTHDDMRIDRVVASTSKDQIPLDRMSDVLDALSNAEDVTLDGKPVKTSSERIKPLATVEDAPNGAFTLRVVKDPRVSSVVGLGVALVEGVLRPLGETATTGERLERLPLVRTFAKNEETELVTRVIPELEKTIEVDVRAKRLA